MQPPLPPQMSKTSHPCEVAGYLPTTASEIKFSYSRKFCTVKRDEIPSSYAFDLGTATPKGYKIPFDEFRAIGPPPSDIGNPGDVWIDLTLNHYALYARSATSWVPWPGPLTTHRLLLANPLIPTRFLWFGNKAVTWLTRASVHQYFSDAKREWRKANIEVPKDASSAISIFLQNEIRVLERKAKRMKTGSHSVENGTREYYSSLFSKHLPPAIRDIASEYPVFSLLEPVLDTGCAKNESLVKNDQQPISEEEIQHLREENARLKLEIDVLTQRNKILCQDIDERHCPKDSVDILQMKIMLENEDDPSVKGILHNVFSLSSRLKAEKVARQACEEAIKELRAELYLQKNQPKNLVPSHHNNGPGTSISPVYQLNDSRDNVITLAISASKGNLGSELPASSKPSNEKVSVDDTALGGHRQKWRKIHYATPSDVSSGVVGVDDHAKGIPSISIDPDEDGSDEAEGTEDQSPFEYYKSVMVRLLYSIKASEYCCRSCLNRQVSFDSTWTVTMFPLSTPDDILLEHCQTVHPATCEDLAHKSKEEIDVIAHHVESIHDDDDHSVETDDNEVDVDYSPSKQSGRRFLNRNL